jgi:hypothetical protein
MANNKKFVVKNGLQTQNIDFVANNESNTTTIIIDDAGLLSVEGNLKISGALYDSNNQTGNVGEVLVSSTDGIFWQEFSGGSGTSGFSGFSGYSGYSGEAGEQGVSGFSGFSGYSGQSGISGYSGTSGYSGSLPQWILVTANYSASDGDRIIADTSGGTFTITLPATPNVGSYIVITDGNDWSANNLLVDNNDSVIEGFNDDLLVTIKGVTVELIYSGTEWQVTATIGASGASGSDGTSGFSGFSGYSGFGQSGYVAVFGRTSIVEVTVGTSQFLTIVGRSSNTNVNFNY